MTRRRRWLPALLAALPVLAYAPAWWNGRLLAPHDGIALHLPLRLTVWEAWRAGELPSWNPYAFGGTPLLAAYRPGALYPPMPALAWLEPLLAFQLLVLGSLALTAAFTFIYLRQLGAHPLGAWFAGLSFSLGPYLVGHLGDTATIVAAPLLPLVLLAAESHMRRAASWHVTRLALVLALLLVAGSHEAARAGVALLLGRLALGHLVAPARRGPAVAASALAVVGGALLAAPQLVPTLLALGEAGRQTAGFADTSQPLPGITGLILRYVSHTPAPALALAALPLALTRLPVRVFGAALGLCLLQQWGRGPLAAPGAAALVFDLALAILGGLSLSALWRRRRSAAGRRLRAYFLLGSLAGAAALSVAAAALGPLPEGLAGAVGILALALILFFTLAEAADPLVAAVFVLPLSVSFVLQPLGRAPWASAPTSAELRERTPTRRAIESAAGERRREPMLTLTRRWPAGAAADLAFAGWGSLTGQVQVTGYDPMVPLRTRRALGDAGPAGALPGAFFRSDPERLALLGVRWVQAPDEALLARPDEHGLGERFDLTLTTDESRFFAVPLAPASELRVASWMSDAMHLSGGAPVARAHVRLASGRWLEPISLLVGPHTGEWAWEREDVRAGVRHRRPPLLESFAATGFTGHRYLARLPLPGRYLVDGVRIERLGGAGVFTLAAVGFVDATTGGVRAPSLVAAYLSDAVFRETAAPPGVRLFELPGSLSPARVVPGLSGLADDDDVLDSLAQPRAAGVEPRRTALAVASEVEPLGAGIGAASSQVRAAGGRLELRAEGPGVLVVATSWDSGWRAEVDGRDAPIWRVQHARIGIPLSPGAHRILLKHTARGFVAGLALAGLGLALLAAGATRRPLAGRGGSGRSASIG